MKNTIHAVFGTLLLDMLDNLGSLLVGGLLVAAFLAVVFLWSLSRLLQFDAEAKREGRIGLAVVLVVALIVVAKVFLG